MRRKTLLILLSLALVGIAVVLVSRETGGAGGAVAAPTPTGVSEQVRRLDLPLDAYLHDAAARDTISRARAVLMSRCMRQHGLDWPSRPAPVHPDGSFPNRRRYGVIELAVARAYGYHPPPGDVPAQVGALSAAQREAAGGRDGRSGCAGAASAVLRRGVERVDLSVVNRLNGELFRRTRQQPEVVTAVRAWADCMRRGGFPHEDPMEINNDPRWRSATPSGVEIATATADVRCKDESGLVTVWHGAEVAAQTAAMPERAAELGAVKAANERELANARAVLAEG